MERTFPTVYTGRTEFFEEGEEEGLNVEETTVAQLTRDASSSDTNSRVGNRKVRHSGRSSAVLLMSSAIISSDSGE